MSIIDIRSGDNLSIVYTIVDENNAVVDLSGGTITWDILVSGTTTALVTKSSPSGGVELTTPTSGIATVALNPADTTGLRGTYQLDGEFTDSSSNVYTFEDGGIYIS